MAKSYKGIDRVDTFFAHYGRKGMKRGMNIYNPNYKPIGEKAKGTLDGNIAQRAISAKAKRGAMTGDPRYSNSPKISVTGVQPSAKDSEMEAMNAAAGRASITGAKNQALSSAEKNVQRSSEENRKLYELLISDRHDPSPEQIDKINKAFETVVNSTERLKNSNVMQEILRDNSKKAMAMKAMSLMEATEKSKREQTRKNLTEGEPRIKVENDAQINVEDNSSKGREREAMNRASSAATKSGAKSAREKLLEAERKRQAAIDRR